MEEIKIPDDQRERIDSIINYWFGETKDRNAPPSQNNFKKWFGSSVETD